MHHNSIGFFYPTRSVGGAQYLFARMAEYLIEHTSYEVVLMDYEDGFIRKKLAGKNYRFIEYRDGNVIAIQEPLLLVLSLSFLSVIDKYFELPQRTGLFFWDLHPYNLVEQLALSGIYKRLRPIYAHRICSLVERSRCKKLVCFVEQGAAMKGLAFMAEHNRHYNQQLLGFSAQVEYLPIPIETIAQSTSHDSKSRENIESTINVGWLSRLDSWKVTVLYRLFDDIKGYEEMHGPGSIHLHVIGDGPEQDTVQAKCAGSNISMVGRLEGDALTEYMLANLHMGFAMGTSALEFAVRGIPTILTPSHVTSENTQRDAIYRWLFDSQGYDVAAEETTRLESLHSFSEIVRCIRNSTVGYLGEQCRDYVVSKHDVNRVGALLVEHLSQCILRYSDIQGLGMYQFTWAEHMLFGLKQLVKNTRNSSCGYG